MAGAGEGSTGGGPGVGVTELVSKLDQLDARLDGMALTLTKQQTILEEHIRRTEAAEEGLSDLRAEVAPLKTHVAVMGALGKVLSFGGVAASLVYNVGKMLGKF